MSLHFEQSCFHKPGNYCYVPRFFLKRAIFNKKHSFKKKTTTKKHVHQGPRMRSPSRSLKKNFCDPKSNKKQFFSGRNNH